MSDFRYDLKEYSKRSSKAYNVGVKSSQSMQLAQKTIIEVSEKFIPEFPLDILEIGGGNGDIMQEMSNRGHNTYSITNSEEELRELENKGLKVVFSDMHNLNTFESNFDLVLCSHVFEHSFAPYILMTEFNEVLKQNGIVIIIVPNQEAKWVYEDYHYIVPTADQLKNLAQKCGFETLRCDIEDYAGMNHLIYVGQKERYWKE